MRQIAEFIEHSARMECGVELAATEFPPSYRRGTILQATLAALGLLASVAAWLARATFWWLVGGSQPRQHFLGTRIPPLRRAVPECRDCSSTPASHSPS